MITIEKHQELLKKYPDILKYYDLFTSEIQKSALGFELYALGLNRTFTAKHNMNLLDSFKPITTLIFDIDGVLTDGSLMVFETGEQVRQMSVRDGYALQLAVKKKYHVAVISGGNGLGAAIRLEKLGIKNIFLNVEDKAEILEEYPE